MAATARVRMLVGFVALFAACATPDSPAPAPSPIPAAPSTVPPPATNVPPLSGPATSYHYSGPLLHPVSAWTTTSQYVLYDNGAFSLHFPSSPAGGGTAVGSYGQEGDRIGFRFVPGGNDAFATGILKGDLLEIRYSEIMVHSDYEDAVYRRSP
jgi:hypothetical protein